MGQQDSPEQSASSTPAQTAPTPVSTSFLKGDSASNHATPTSASSANKSGAGSKKNKKNDEDDSEADAKEPKKARAGALARK
jgi:chromatin modification-related protein EAF6